MLDRETLWNFMRHFTALHFSADCTWVLQSPVTEEGTFQRVTQGQTLLQALTLGSPLTAVGIKGNKTNYIIWIFRYWYLGSVDVRAVKIIIKGQLLNPNNPGAPY